MLRNAQLVGVVLGSVVLALAGMQGSAAASPQAESVAFSAATVSSPRLIKLVAEAKHQTTLGISYLYGGGHGASPAPLNSHVDCSGLVRELYHYAFGVDIGGGSGDGMIRTSGKFTRTSHPVPGDVVLLGNGGSAPAYHTGVYIGSVNGEPAMVGSPTTGQNIKVQPSRGGSWGGDLMGYWHYNGATAADSAVATPTPTPRMRGNFDAASGRLGSVAVSGWVVDPQRTGSGARAEVLIDGQSLAMIGTPVGRSDVNRALSISGSHGFNTGIGVGPGRHTICINARPSGTSSIAVSLGCKPVTVPPTPTRGSFDTLTSVPGSFAITGWALDIRSPNASNAVRITLDGRVVATVGTSKARPDVNRAYGISGTHGFYSRIGVAKGSHTVCTTSLPTTATSAATNLGCKTIAVP